MLIDIFIPKVILFDYCVIFIFKRCYKNITLLKKLTDSSCFFDKVDGHFVLGFFIFSPLVGIVLIFDVAAREGKETTK